MKLTKLFATMNSNNPSLKSMKESTIYKGVLKICKLTGFSKHHQL